MREYAVLIPAYNAAQSLPELLRRLAQLGNRPVQVVVVNDGSSDNTAGIADQYAAKVVNLEKNMGKGYALRTGFSYFLEQQFCGVLICLDADLQHPPEVIPEFIIKTEQGHCPVIIGNRNKTPGRMPFHRIMSNRITSGIISLLTGQNIPDSQCGFRMIRMDVLKDLYLRENGFQMESEFILKVAARGFRIDSVPVPVVYTDHGSHISNIADTLRFIMLIIKYLMNRL